MFSSDFHHEAELEIFFSAHFYPVQEPPMLPKHTQLEMLSNIEQQITKIKLQSTSVVNTTSSSSSERAIAGNVVAECINIRESLCEIKRQLRHEQTNLLHHRF